MRFLKSNDAAVDEENPYWMSFSDIMSALLVIFILASVILILQLMDTQERFNVEVSELKKAEEVRRTILDDAVKALGKRGIVVEISQNHTVLSIPSDLLGFESGAHEIQEELGKHALVIGKVLNQVISHKNRFEFLDTVFIEGHTDNQRFHGTKGNWGLSTFRAISLWQFWEDRLSDKERLSRLHNTDRAPLFSVSGYADTRPVVSNQTTEEDFKRNRRIDIRFTIRRPDSAQYERIKGTLSEKKP